ncbi:uncharacterized protein LOC125519283 isoform X2 [Triticum urartu]|uniref:uncharacterized protein LOC125519283 isoform X2 n=2 Tax=Triticum urartu TaxID=4572 RepID=UPI002044C70D|nr:uncharacterized protein LOC125519283 isoform X2 [Triticum urartu]
MPSRTPAEPAEAAVAALPKSGRHHRHRVTPPPPPSPDRPTTTAALHGHTATAAHSPNCAATATSCFILSITPLLLDHRRRRASILLCPPRPSFSAAMAFLLSHRRRESYARHRALPPSSSRPASWPGHHCAEQCHHAQPSHHCRPSSSMMLLPSSSMLLPPSIQSPAPGSLRIELPRAHKLFVYIPQTKRYDATWEIVMHLRLVPPQDPVRLLSSAFLYAQQCVSPRRLPLLLLGTEMFHEIPLHLYVIFRDVP